MHNVMLQMFFLIACGALWRHLKPVDIDPEVQRRTITSLVYYLLLPALVLQVMWHAPLGLDSARIAIVAASGVLFGLAVAGIMLRTRKVSKTVAGSILLAAGFPNATYLGLPVLEGSFGPWARSVAIQFDLLACTPLLMSLGVMLAQRCGGYEAIGLQAALKALCKVPPLWALVVAIVLNLTHVSAPAIVDEALILLGHCVIPLMLLSLGMSLRWGATDQSKRGWLLLVAIIQLLLCPLFAYFIGQSLGMQKMVFSATVIEAAMPCMVLGIVICDRYGLDTSFYAAAVTVSTIGSFLSLPLWLLFLNMT